MRFSFSLFNITVLCVEHFYRIVYSRQDFCCAQLFFSLSINASRFFVAFRWLSMNWIADLILLFLSFDCLMFGILWCNLYYLFYDPLNWISLSLFIIRILFFFFCFYRVLMNEHKCILQWENYFYSVASCAKL